MKTEVFFQNVVLYICISGYTVAIEFEDTVTFEGHDEYSFDVPVDCLLQRPSCFVLRPVCRDRSVLPGGGAVHLRIRLRRDWFCWWKWDF